MYLLNPIPARRRAARSRRRRTGGLPSWVRVLEMSRLRTRNPRRSNNMARRRRRRSSRASSRRSRKSSRRSFRRVRRKRGGRARRRASRSRRSNPARRKRRGGRARRRAGGRRRRVARKTRSRSRSRRSKGRSRSRSRSRRSNPSGIFRSVKSSLKSLTNAKSVGSTVKDGLQLSLGFAGVNALRAIEGSIGIDRIMVMAPPGIARTIAEYALKWINVGLVGTIGNMLGRKFGANAKGGGMVNFGVTLLSDVSGFFGGTGDTVRGYLTGVGDYNLAYGMGTAMSPRLPQMGNYNLAAGGQAMSPVSGYEVYPPSESIYG